MTRPEQVATGFALLVGAVVLAGLALCTLVGLAIAHIPTPVL